MIGTAYWYMHTDQWRFDGYAADALASPLAGGNLAGMHTADTIAQSARLGWMPFYPQFNLNPPPRPRSKALRRTATNP